ncbi:MFS transporter [Rhodococcus sp. (in: high G+C Gram-positive bacteria)]|uniref:MFS transporter n=1 Tax=Rhodococcus sp. TaxID=1831 RepID=UPI00257B6C30|nr:MFS transporter [Rhodococcus sp. (in: high G+C Gram-positive bacteria)]
MAVSLANALIFFDQTSITVMLPAMQVEFDSTSTELQWTVGAYLLTLAALMSVSGRLADLYGRRRLFVVGLFVFGLASLLCAFAPTVEALIAARLLEGCGAALTMPLTIANLTAVLPDDRRGWAIGILATGGTIFLALGPLVGGVLVDHASWRWVFALNLPVVMVAMWLSTRWLPESRDDGRSPPDLWGLVLLVVGLSALVTSLLNVHDWGPRSARTIIVSITAVVALTIFVVVERRSSHPLLPLRFLRIPLVAGSLTALCAIQFAVLAVTVYLMLYMQLVLGYSGVVAGLLFLPTVLGTPLLSPWTGRLTDAHGPHLLVTGGLLCAAVALLWIAVFSPARNVLLLLPAFVLFGVSRPFVFTPAGTGPVRAISSSARGLASSLVTESRQIGAVLGVAVVGAVVTTVELAHRTGALGTGFDNAERRALDGVLTGGPSGTALLDGLPHDQARAVRDAAADAYAVGFSVAMGMVAAVMVAAAIVAAITLNRITEQDGAAS